jgi:hypothetical protein
VFHRRPPKTPRAQGLDPCRHVRLLLRAGLEQQGACHAPQHVRLVEPPPLEPSLVRVQRHGRSAADQIHVDGEHERRGAARFSRDGGRCNLRRAGGVAFGEPRPAVGQDRRLAGWRLRPYESRRRGPGRAECDRHDRESKEHEVS